jgi:hypothetical protein
MYSHLPHDCLHLVNLNYTALNIARVSSTDINKAGMSIQ